MEKRDSCSTMVWPFETSTLLMIFGGLFRASRNLCTWSCVAGTTLIAVRYFESMSGRSRGFVVALRMPSSCERVLPSPSPSTGLLSGAAKGFTAVANSRLAETFWSWGISTSCDSQSLCRNGFKVTLLFLPGNEAAENWARSDF